MPRSRSHRYRRPLVCNDTAPSEMYTLSLHDALPILEQGEDAADERIQEDGDQAEADHGRNHQGRKNGGGDAGNQDRKSTRLNSSHVEISYAVFCLKKKNRER